MTKLWVKLKPNNAVKVSTEDCQDVYDFIKEVKKELSPLLNPYAPAQLSLSTTAGGPSLRPGLLLTNIPSQPGYSENDDEHPLFITITGVSAASPAQVASFGTKGLAFDGPSPQVPTNTSTRSPLVGKVLSVSINQNKLIKKYLTPVGSSPTTPVGNPSTPIDLSTLGLELEQLMFWKNTTARPCIVIDVQRRSEQSFLEESPPITIVLITGFDGKPLNEVMAEEEFKRVMPIRPTPSLPGTATPINTTPEWIPGNPKGKIPSYVLCIPIKVCVQNLRRIETELKVDAQNLEKLKLHILSLGGISANADFEDLEEDDSDDDMDVSCERFNRIVSWDEIVV